MIRCLDLNKMDVEDAFRKGLLNRGEYMGYLKGTAIDYILNCDKRDNSFDDLDHAVQLIFEMYYLIGSEKLEMSVDEFKQYSELVDALNSRCECNECKDR